MAQRRIISFVNFKGGIGKTNTSVNFAYFCAVEQNLRTLLVDWDPQGDATKYIGVDPETVSGTMLDIMTGTHHDKVIVPTPYDNLFLVPATEPLKHAYNMLGADEENYDIFRSKLEDFANIYDVVVIDCPPQNSPVNVASIFGSTSIFLVTSSKSDSIDKLALVEKMINDVATIVRQNTENNGEEGAHFPALKGILHTLAKYRTNEYGTAQEHLEKHWKDLLIHPSIPDTVTAGYSVNLRRPIFVFQPNALICQTYREAFMEVLRRASS